MYIHSTLGSDLTDTSPLLEACRDLTNTSSLVELERQLNYWLPRCYAPHAWTIVCSVLGSDEPLFELKGQDELAGTGQLGAPVTIPLQVGSSIRGQLELYWEARRQPSIHVMEELSQFTHVLSSKLGQVSLQLQSLAQTAELLFMRSLLHGEAASGVDRNLDELAATLLGQLDVSSIQVLIDQLGPGGLCWGIASRRVSLALSLEQRQRLLQLVQTTFRGTETEALPYFLARRAQINTLQAEFGLPYLAQLQSLLIVPIRNGQTLLGAVIVGEERSWARQPISPQVVSVCALLARSVAKSVTQNQFLTEVVARERSMQALIDALDDAVVTAKHGMISSWNRAAHEIFGYRAAEVVGRTIGEVLPGIPVELVSGGEHTNVRDGAKRSCEWRMRTTSGRGLFLACTVTAVPASDVDAPRTVYIFRDMSQQHELEYLKEELLSSVSHELRTPLNGIYGFSRLLLDRPNMPDAMRHEALESLQASIERLTRLADDFIDVARARRHRLPLELDDADIEQVVRSAVREIKRRHPDYTIALRVQKGLPLVRGDSMRIRQILDNLVSNAAKYAAEGTRISLDVRRHGAMVAISVSDHGLGIPKAVQQRIFDPFYRADNSRSRRASGVGLGLSIVKSLVQAHDGQVSVRSRVGRGSTFTFTLPLSASGGQPEPEASAAASEE